MPKSLRAETIRLKWTHTDGDATQIDRLEVLAEQAALQAKHVPAHYLVTARHRSYILRTTL